MPKLLEYNKIKDDLRTGDVITFAGNGIISRIIRIASARSHVATVVRLRDYEGTEKRRFILEANGLNGISLHLLSKRLEEYDGRAWWLPLRPEFDIVRPSVGAWAFAQIGTKYDYKGLVLNALGRVSEDAKAYFCSEFSWQAVKTGTILERRMLLQRQEDDAVESLILRILCDSAKIKNKAARPGDFLKFTETFGEERPLL